MFGLFNLLSLFGVCVCVCVCVCVEGGLFFFDLSLLTFLVIQGEAGSVILVSK